MTGIYGGLATSIGWMAVRGRFRCTGTPPMSVCAVLFGAGTVLAIDGFNSLLVDIQRNQLYEPSNAARLVTGIGTGMAMATVLAWLVATSLWTRTDSASSVRSWGELWQVALVATPWLAILWFRPDVAYALITILLLASAWLTITLLFLVLAVLTFRLDGSFSGLAQLHLPCTGAAIAALCFMLLMSGGRFWLERAFGLGSIM